MPTIRTLNVNSDFRRAYMRGRSYTNPVLVMYVVKNRTGLCRVGITSSKKIGNAVERNRARRVIREAYRQLPFEINGGYDIVFVARTKTVHKKSTDVYKAMLSMLQDAGLANGSV